MLKKYSPWWRRRTENVSTFTQADDMSKIKLQAFNAAKMFLEKNGGWDAHAFRIDRQAEQAENTVYKQERMGLAYRILQSTCVESHGVELELDIEEMDVEELDIEELDIEELECDYM